MNETDVDIIIPVIGRDLPRLERTIPALRQNLKFRKIILIGPSAELEGCKLVGSGVTFYDEASLVDLPRLRELMSARSNHDEPTQKRVGWYAQQFVKMAYAFVCKDPYYLVWDADTVPCKNYSPFTAEGRPVFDTKTECHRPYFNTLQKLFSDVGRTYPDRSFISEHMVIDAALMREMVGELGGRENFAEHILNAIDLNDLPNSGFSEFETFGNWVLRRHPCKYDLRRWHSFRHVGEWFDTSNLTSSDVDWIRRSYDAMSFESYVKMRPLNRVARLWLGNRLVRSLFSFRMAVYVAIFLGIIPLKYRHIN